MSAPANLDSSSQNANTVRYHRWQYLDTINLISNSKTSLLIEFMKSNAHVMSHSLTFLTLSERTCFFRTSKKTIVEMSSKQITLNSARNIQVPKISMTNLFHSHPVLSYFGSILPHIMYLNLITMNDHTIDMDEFSCFRHPSHGAILPTMPNRNAYTKKNFTREFNFKELVSQHSMAIAESQQQCRLLSLRSISICAHPYVANQIIEALSDSVLMRLHHIVISPPKKHSYQTPTACSHSLSDESQDCNAYCQERCSELYTRMQYCTNLETLQIQHPLLGIRYNQDGDKRINEYSTYLCSVKSFPVNLQELSLSSLKYYTSEFTDYISRRAKNLTKFVCYNCMSSDSPIIRSDDLFVMQYCDKWNNNAIVTTDTMTSSITELDVTICIDEIPNLSRLSSLTNLSIVFSWVDDLRQGMYQDDEDEEDDDLIQANMVTYSSALMKYAQHIPLKKLKISANYSSGKIFPDPAILRFEQLEELEIVSATIRFPDLQMCRKLQKLTFTDCSFVFDRIHPLSYDPAIIFAINEEILNGISCGILGLKILSLRILNCNVIKDLYNSIDIIDCNLTDLDTTTLRVSCERNKRATHYLLVFECHITN